MSQVDPVLQTQILRGHLPTAHRVGRVAEARAGQPGADPVGVHEDLRREVLGLGPLEGVLADPAVTDVLVNGVAGTWVDRGRGVEAAGVHLTDETAVRRLAVRLAGLAGQRLDDACPYVDAVLPGGVRLHAVMPPLVEGATHLSLRVPRRETPDLETLRAWGMVDRHVAEVLRGLVRRRVAFVVGGGTGTGKTTLLGALLALVPPTERIVVVEDTRELRVDHPHVVHLQARGRNVEGRGEVTLTTLVRQSLRMRPDRLVLGEVRGAEVRELLTAMNTGHEGGCGTLHANSAADVVSRFEALGALAGLDVPAVHTQVASAVQVVLHLAIRDGTRQLAEVGVLTREHDRARVLPALTTGPSGCRPGPGHDVLLRLLDPARSS
jgi:pilus assembly protein CpaF